MCIYTHTHTHLFLVAQHGTDNQTKNTYVYMDECKHMNKKKTFRYIYTQAYAYIHIHKHTCSANTLPAQMKAGTDMYTKQDSWWIHTHTHKRMNMYANVYISSTTEENKKQYGGLFTGPSKGMPEHFPPTRTRNDARTYKKETENTQKHSEGLELRRNR